MNYWPWWAGAIGLAVVTINYTLSTDRSFGVSSAWDRVLHWRSERRIERMDAEFADERELEAAIAAATAEEFGAQAAAPVGAHGPGQAPGHGTVAPAPGGYRAPGEPVQDARPQAPAAATAPRLAPLITQAALLLSIFAGGLIAAVSSGRFQLRYDMGEGFRHLVTANPTVMVCVLFLGGILVGFGTRLAGGCSSGHGLSGCGRLRPVSIVATAVFFGTAVLVSFLLWKVI